jgi:hypothetical protein
MSAEQITPAEALARAGRDRGAAGPAPRGHAARCRAGADEVCELLGLEGKQGSRCTARAKLRQALRVLRVSERILADFRPDS